MGTIHQLRWDRPRKRSAPEISPRRGGPSIFFGVLFIAAAIGATAFWREAALPGWLWMFTSSTVTRWGPAAKKSDWSALTRRSCDRPAATGKAENGHADEQRKLVLQSRSHKATSHALRAAAIATVNISRRVADKRSQAGKLAL